MSLIISVRLSVDSPLTKIQLGMAMRDFSVIVEHITNENNKMRGGSNMATNTVKHLASAIAKPVLKWAGGKTQMLSELLPKVPTSYGRYIEPFLEAVLYSCTAAG